MVEESNKIGLFCKVIFEFSALRLLFTETLPDKETYYFLLAFLFISSLFNVNSLYS